MLKKSVVLLLLSSIILLTLTSCSGSKTYKNIGDIAWNFAYKTKKTVTKGYNYAKYNANMDSFVEEYIKPEFIKQHPIRNSEIDYYNKEEYPYTKTFIITSQEEMDNVFIEDAFNVNFDKEVAYLHFFLSGYGQREYYIQNIKQNSEKILIYYTMEENQRSDYSRPGLRCLLVTMEKTNASDVEFVEVR